jgi:hypothetical protein
MFHEKPRSPKIRHNTNAQYFNQRNEALSSETQSILHQYFNFWNIQENKHSQFNDTQKWKKDGKIRELSN